MEKYKLYWKNDYIGTLYVDNNKHKYVPNTEKIEELKGKVPLDPVLLQERDWGEKIPFFNSRLESGKKFPDLEIGNHTDSYQLRLTE